MVLSMTGFGKDEQTNAQYKVTVEAKSLNSRNADIKIKAPAEFRNNEFEIRNIVTAALQRGKIDVVIDVVKLTDAETAQINEDRFIANYNLLKKLATQTQSSTDVFSLALKMPEVIESRTEALQPELWQLAIEALHNALKNLNNFRKEEGATLVSDFYNRLQAIEASLLKVEQLAPERIKAVEDRLAQKIDELNTLNTDDKSRLHQEVVFYLEKFDINEEIVRLKSHCNYLKQTLAEEESQGKKIGFIAQEMGREINTIGSKANHAEIQKLVVMMKDELEKIKEQSLNVL